MSEGMTAITEGTTTRGREVHGRDAAHDCMAGASAMAQLLGDQPLYPVAPGLVVAIRDHSGNNREAAEKVRQRMLDAVGAR